MSAILKEPQIDDIRRHTEELESMDAAILELSQQIAHDERERGKLWARLEELQSGRAELRRKRIRTYLDLKLGPPITFYDIEAVGPRIYEQFNEEHYQRVLLARLELARGAKTA